MIELPTIQPEQQRDICSIQCGARCCRTPLSTPVVTGMEMRKLKAIAWSRGLKLKFLNASHSDVYVKPDGVEFKPNPAKGRDRWVMLRGDNGCQFLGQTSNLCTIYDERPAICRDFPRSPVQGCLLTPDATEDHPTLLSEAA